MFVPGITFSSTLGRRKGGGGGGRAGGSGGISGSSGGKSGSSGGKSGGYGSQSGSYGGKSGNYGQSGSKGGTLGNGGSGSGWTSDWGSSSTSRSPSWDFNFGGKSKYRSSAYGRGGGKARVIPKGQLFAGRSVGGGKRNQVFGTRSYGSGYGSGYPARGVSGHPFPFFFWPLVWGGGAMLATGTYLDARREYGDINNSTRPGGPLATAMFQSPSSNSKFRLVADNNTVTSLIRDLSRNCSSKFSTNPAPTSSLLDSSAPLSRPEQVVQYYHASSIALTLDGYNNSATYAPEGTLDSPLPSGVDMNLLTCLNETIGLAAPLVNGANLLWAPSYFNLIGLVWTIWVLMKLN